MGPVLRTTVLFCFFALPVMADPEADRKRLAEALYSDDVLDASFEVMLPVLSGSLESQFRTLGITISDPVAFTDVFAQEFRVRFAENVRTEMAVALKDIFTDEEITEIAAFLDTPAGAKYFAAQAELTRVGFRIGEMAGMQAGTDAAERVATRMNAEGITFTDAEGTQLDALKVLRGY
jgi:hypothetical protein